jgi:hypothetical protein
MGVYSGIGAAAKIGASVETTLSGWKVQESNRAARYSASQTGGADTSTAGNNDWKGWYRTYAHTPLPFPGETFAFLGSIDGSLGVSGAAICERLILTCPIEAGKNIDCRVEFSSNGALSYGAAEVADTSTVQAYNAAGRKMAKDGTDVADTRFWRLVMGARNKPHAGSSNAAVVMRTPGVVYANWVYQAYTNDPTTVPVKGSTAALRFYVTASTYWSLFWNRYENINEFGADIEGQENVLYTAAGSFAGWLGTALGHIKNPAGVAKWGA